MPRQNHSAGTRLPLSNNVTLPRFGPSGGSVAIHLVCCKKSSLGVASGRKRMTLCDSFFNSPSLSGEPTSTRRSAKDVGTVSHHSGGRDRRADWRVVASGPATVRPHRRSLYKTQDPEADYGLL
jgi:hypothetical protein